MASETAETTLRKVIDWKGAFVIGLAGTILVTGVTGPVVGEIGAAAIPNFIVTTVAGLFLCLILAELATMFPDRAGGTPSYAYMGLTDKFPRLAPHVNGISAWGYWLGWNPVIAVNMLLVAAYINALLKPFSIKIPALLIGSLFAVLLFIPAYFGIRPGAGVGVVLAILSIVPLIIIAIAPFFKPSIIQWDFLLPITAKGQPFWSGASLGAQMKMFFLTTWNAMAMEAAACYLAECRDPHRDAPRAMIAEGALGVFVYTLVPLAFLLVLGPDKIAADPYAMFVDFVGPIFGRIGAWLVALMLLAALLLSALNAIMGCARSLYQIAEDGQFPRIFGRLNRHGVPAWSMAFNVVLNIGLMLMAVPAFIMIFSNVGYVLSLLPVLYAYWVLRNEKPALPRPFRLPEWMKYIALALAVFLTAVWLVGGPMWGATYYGLGWAVLLAYIPLYLYRKRVEDRRYSNSVVLQR